MDFIWLRVLAKLTDADRREIVDAVNNFSPKYRSDPVSYYATPQRLVFLDHDEVITALRKVFEHYGTTAVLPIIESLSAPPPYECAVLGENDSTDSTCR
jgi:hypothetical protein